MIKLTSKKTKGIGLTTLISSAAMAKNGKDNEKGKQMNRLESYSKRPMWIFALLLTTFMAGCGIWDKGSITGPSDTTAPTVSSTVPVNVATGVAINTAISATFSEAMDPLTVTNVTFTLKQGNTSILGTVTYSNVSAVFVPASNLAYNTVYTVTITTGVKDLAGNAMAAPYILSWTTGKDPDTTAPTVNSVIPTNLATGVAINSAITAIFSEMLDPLTVTNVTFTLKLGTSPVFGTVHYSGNTATFTPFNSLVANTVYTATITTGIKDLTGNALSNNFTWSFTTGAQIVRIFRSE